MWKHYVVYEFRPCSVIITLGKQLYMIAEGVSTIAMSLITSKQGSKVISHTGKFVLFMIFSKGEQNITATSTTSTHSLCTHYK